MTTLDFKIIDLDFPVGSKNKTATLIIGERDARQRTVRAQSDRCGRAERWAPMTSIDLREYP